MLSINNDLHWSPEDKDAEGELELVKAKNNRLWTSEREWRQYLTAIDWTLALCVLSPLCILYWRGTWQLLDIYLKELDSHITFVKHPGGYASLFTGYLLTFACNATQRWVTNVITDIRRNYVVRLFVSRLFTVLFALGLVNLWRGVWQLLDTYFTYSWFSGAGSAVVGVWALASLRALRNIAAPPVVINTDYMDDEYTCSPTMFQTLSTNKSTWFFLFDVAFSVMVVGSLVVFVWRGIWTVMDRLLFPTSPPMSCWMSLAIGYFIVFISYLLQRPFASASKNFKSNFERILFEDAFYLFASFGAISVWRGVWLCADVYLYPDDREFSNWLTMIFGLMGLMLLVAGNTMLAKGVYIDGGIKDGGGCKFSTEYLRKFFKDNIEMVKRIDGGAANRLSPHTPAVNNSQTNKLLNADTQQLNIQNVSVEVIVERETVT